MKWFAENMKGATFFGHPLAYEVKPVSTFDGFEVQVIVKCPNFWGGTSEIAWFDNSPKKISANFTQISEPTYIKTMTFDFWLVELITIPMHILQEGQMEARQFLFDRIEDQLIHSFGQQLKFFGSPNK